MKQLWLALLLAVALTGCGENDTAPGRSRGNLGEEFALRPGEAILFGPQRSPAELNAPAPLLVELLEATDERCPSFVVCIQPGKATAKLRVSQGGLATTQDLCIGLCASPFYRETDAVPIQLGADQFVLHLRRIDSQEDREQFQIVQQVVLLLEKK